MGCRHLDTEPRAVKDAGGFGASVIFYLSLIQEQDESFRGRSAVPMRGKSATTF